MNIISLTNNVIYYIINNNKIAIYFQAILVNIYFCGLKHRVKIKQL